MTSVSTGSTLSIHRNSTLKLKVGESILLFPLSYGQDVEGALHSAGKLLSENFRDKQKWKNIVQYGTVSTSSRRYRSG